MRLIYATTRADVQIGDNIETKSGEKGVVTFFRPPHKPSSSGKVSILLDGDEQDSEYYVEVIGAEWIEREDREPLKVSGLPAHQTPLSDSLVNQILHDLPHGSGIDDTWRHEFSRGRDRFLNSFHCMDENGYYCGWQDFEIQVFTHKKDVLNPLKGPLEGKVQIVHQKGDVDWSINYKGIRTGEAYLHARSTDLLSYLYDVIEPTMTNILGNRQFTLQ